jgi:hypothetical protein
VKYNHSLNPNVVNTCTSTTDGLLDFLFDISISSVEANDELFLIELLFLCHCVVNLIDDLGSPLIWWKEHAMLYSNVAFLAKQILAILNL